MGPPLATKLPELVRDSKLETTFNGDNTVHFYYDRPGRHAEPQREEWKKERLIGSGGNGVVWLEKRLAASSGEANQARYRAVKQITLAQPRSILEICKSELEALAKFSTRKYARCFVRSFGWYEDSGSLSIAMEYCPLGDLQQFLIENNRPPESDTREIIGQVVQGLQFMHDEGFAHRDLKPGNILIKSHPPKDEWWVKICDMGLSKRIEGVGAATTAVKGTPGFFAPEQLGLGGTDPKMADPFKTDIWCLGEMTFRILCGEAAFPSHNDLRRYHQGAIMFPRERLSKIGVSEPAISFIASAMLVDPQSRLEAHQAFNHEWLMNINNDPTVGQKDPSLPALDPSCSEPDRDSCPGAEPSGTWSTVSLPLRPSRTQETVRPYRVDGREHSEVPPGPPLDSQNIRRTSSLQESEPVIDNENRSCSPRPPSRTDSQYRTSRRDESPSIDYQDQKESCSPNAATTAAAGPPIIRITEAGSVKDDGNIGCSIEPQAGDTYGQMQQLIDIENYFNDNLQPRSLYYLNGALSDSKQREAEFRWLRNITECDILHKADNLESQGNEKFRARRKALIDRVNAMLDELESANRRFIKQEEGQEEVSSEGSTTNLRLQSQQRLAREEREKEDQKERQKEREKDRMSAVFEKVRSRHTLMYEETSSSLDSSDEDFIYEPPPKADRKKWSSTMESAIRYLHRSSKAPSAFTRPQTFSKGSTMPFGTPRIPTPPPLEETSLGETSTDDEMPRRVRGQPRRRYSEIARDTPPIRPKPRDGIDKFPHRRSRATQPPLATSFDQRDSTHGPSSSYDRPIPVPHFTRVERWYETNEEPILWKRPFAHHETSGRPPLAPRPTAATDGVLGKSPRSELTDSSIRNWLAGVVPFPPDS
ncbi:kinase-like domain-containing protein [Xylaria digitata]|nr:kinase-like domain-containing protein [Xylaria digitata]